MDLLASIKEWKEKRRAVILAHNYQTPAIQDLADFRGDSLDLSRRAAATDAEVIVFCGVHFMAETAAILAPQKKVLLPDLNAGCPMANMITARELKSAREKHPDAVVVTYVNSSAAVKSLSDICCTSANAVEVVASVPQDKDVLFIPDQNLGQYVSRCLNRPLILWPGYCPTHHRILPEFVRQAMSAHPQAEVVVHPECRPAVVDLAHKVASTSGILKHARESKHRQFIIGTEIGLLYRLAQENPGKEFYPAAEVADCPNMKLITPEKVLWALEELSGEVTVPPEVAARAHGAITKMLAIK